ncbi:MAG: head-tail connector protein [Enhydrobacter sp.]|nr:MAG: head-tail connector protein [Enhydrobacter sp.]
MSRVPATAQSFDTEFALRRHLLRRLSSLDRERENHVPTWRSLAVHFAPTRGRFNGGANDPRRGAPLDTRLIDNTPLIATRTLASGMMAGLSSPARPWFRLRLADDDANAAPGVRAWLDEVQRRLLQIFATSNLYNCLHTLYGELATFGTAALCVDEDEEDVVRGYTLTAGEYWLASSRRLAVDTLYRSMWWSVRQIADTFGRESVSPAVRSAYEAGQLDQEHEIVQAIEPNPNFAGDAMGGLRLDWRGDVPADLPFRSAWFERGQQGERPLLRVGAYEEFPCMAPRWEVAGSDTWGSGPAATTLGDARQLQVQQRHKLEAIEKQVKPPMVGPPSLRNEAASLLPGGITYVADFNGQGFKPAIDVKLDLNALSADIVEVQARIGRAFYADLFLMVASSKRAQVTAREVEERHEEKMLMLGPVLERLHDELLDPLVRRVFNIAARNGLIPPAPPSLPLAALQIEFISLLASAQKAAATGAIERFWQFGARMGALKPEALDRLDADAAMEAFADMIGVPASIVVDRKTAETIRALRVGTAPSAPAGHLPPQAGEGMTPSSPPPPAEAVHASDAGGGGKPQ